MNQLDNIIGSKKYFYHPSGLFLPKQKRPVALDLFAGCGGFSLGIMEAGFEVLGGIDFDVHAAITYITNLGAYPIQLHFIEKSDEERMEKVLIKLFKEENGINKPFTSGTGWIRSRPDVPPVQHFWIGDIRKLTGQDILRELHMKPGDIDLIVGGPPCQGFSYSGKREVMDPRNSLVFEFAHMIIDIQPKTFVMENVPGIVTMVTPEGIPVIDAFSRIIADGGFGSYEAIKKTLLDTSGAGAVMKGSKTIKEYRHKHGDSQENEASEQLNLF